MDTKDRYPVVSKPFELSKVFFEEKYKKLPIGKCKSCKKKLNKLNNFAEIVEEKHFAFLLRNCTEAFARNLASFHKRISSGNNLSQLSVLVNTFSIPLIFSLPVEIKKLEVKLLDAIFETERTFFAAMPITVVLSYTSDHL